MNNNNMNHHSHHHHPQEDIDDTPGTMGDFIDRHIGSKTLDKLSPHVLQRKTREMEKKKKKKKSKRNPVKAATRMSREQRIMLSLQEDIHNKELQTQKLLHKIERAERAKQQSKELEREANDCEGSLEKRLEAMEAEHKKLQATLEERQAKVDGIKMNIENLKNSNARQQEAFKMESGETLPLLMKQQNLHSELRDADIDVYAWENKANRTKQIRSLENELKEIYEKAYKDILKLQKKHQKSQ